MTKKKALVALSGGIDSGCAALKLLRSGYDVIGVYMTLSELSDATAAREMASALGIEFYVKDIYERFTDKVVAPFAEAYISGNTPNPCVICNRRIKFGYLVDLLDEMDCDYLATGHYCRVESDADGYYIRRPRDVTKDQTYFLWNVDPDAFSRVIFPMAEITKPEARELLAQVVPASRRIGESQEVCFIPNDDYGTFLAGEFGAVPGPGDIIDETGTVVGQHRGYTHYTIGQRRGLGVAAGFPIYVKSIDAKNNIITISENDGLLCDKLVAGSINIQRPLKLWSDKVSAYVRYHDAGALAKVTIMDNSAIVEFDTPRRAIAPGQSVAFYEGDILLGGGIIEKAG